jgi:hypothetical protein
MTDQEQRELVETVQRQIAVLLADLEERTGCYVEGLAVRSIESTKISSAAPEYLRYVEVDLRRQPGSQWQATPRGVGFSEGLGAGGASCANCRYFTREFFDPRSGLGNCRRYPPVLDGLQLLQAKINGHAEDGNEYARDAPFWWSQPCLAEDQWCGEWAASNV